MQYNKNKHLTLLKSLQKSENSRKNVSDEEFLKLLESRPDENLKKVIEVKILKHFSVMLLR